MASWQAHGISFLMRHTFKRRLAREGNEVADLRSIMEMGGYKVPKSITIQSEVISQVPGEWVQRDDGEDKPVLLYLHGGGYFACSPKTHRAATCYFAQAGFRVFAPDYRLAPENPFPAAVKDACAVLSGLRDQLGGLNTVVVAGDSAGGGLALAMMVAEKDAGRSLPAAALLFSPWVDMTISGESVVTNSRRCAMFTPEGIAKGAAMYLDGANPLDPQASPLFADLSELPPLLIHASQAETLRDDSVRLAEKAKQQGVVTEFKIWPVVPHVWQLFHPIMPEGRQSLQLACQFARAHIG